MISEFLEAHDPDAKTRFHRDGVVHLRGVLTPDEIEGLRQAVDVQAARFHLSKTGYDLNDLGQQFFASDQKADTGNADRLDIEYFRQAVTADENARPLFDKMNAPRGADGKFLYDVAGWRSFPQIRRAAMDSVLPEIAAQLMDSAYINFWEDTTFIKTPKTAARTAFHQDKAYFQISGDKCMIAWIPLDPVDQGNGRLEYIRGSHLWGREFAPNVFFAQTAFPDSDAEKLPDIEAHRDDYDIIDFDAEPGDVIIHHVLTVHGSSGNISPDRPRRAISFRYCGDDIRYHERPGALPQPWLNHGLKEGDPLFTHEYPMVWPKRMPGERVSEYYRYLDPGEEIAA